MSPDLRERVILLLERMSDGDEDWEGYEGCADCRGNRDGKEHDPRCELAAVLKELRDGR